MEEEYLYMVPYEENLLFSALYEIIFSDNELD